MNTEPEPYRYKLWKFFADEHGLILTESELDDIVRAVTESEKEVFAL